MRHRRADAKAFARANLRGIWAAALTPFQPDDFALDADGFARNLQHWTRDLGIDGVFVCGKQGEFFALSVAERKQCFDIAVAATKGHGRSIMSCSDQNMDVVIDLARHAEAAGADFIVVHAPLLYFLHDRDDTLFEYYRHISEQVNIGIAMWSHPDSGYLMSPELCARIAELPNIVAIKYSVPREMYTRLTHLAGDNLIVSTASEDEWFDNIVELNWQVYLCSNPPFLYQTATDRRMRDYSDAAFAGDIVKARAIRDSLDLVRTAFKASRPGGKPQAHAKYWMELLGQVGGPVRAPMLQLTDAEKSNIRAAFAQSGLAALSQAAE
jgi:4-hydroxy-tetrahydrodipicolinate synthase